MPAPEEAELTAELPYRDPGAALEWLASAFGFRTRMIVRGADGAIVFAETGWGGRDVAVVPELPQRQRSPASIGGRNTQLVRLRTGEAIDIDALCARAQACDAQVVYGPTTEFTGDRACTIADLEGHLWTFSRRGAAPARDIPFGWTVEFPGSDPGAQTLSSS